MARCPGLLQYKHIHDGSVSWPVTGNSTNIYMMARCPGLLQYKHIHDGCSVSWPVTVQTYT